MRWPWSRKKPKEPTPWLVAHGSEEIAQVARALGHPIPELEKWVISVDGCSGCGQDHEKIATRLLVLEEAERDAFKLPAEEVDGHICTAQFICPTNGTIVYVAPSQKELGDECNGSSRVTHSDSGHHHGD